MRPFGRLVKRLLGNSLKRSSQTRIAPSPLPVPVILYTREGCHLCEAAKALLEKHQRQFFLQINEVDIDGDPRLKARYDDCVPVVAIDGRERFRGHVNEVLLVRTLKRAR